MKRSSSWTVLALAVAAAVCASGPGGGGIVYGGRLAVIMEAPEGWVLDDEAGASQGLHAVFYPAGSSWAAATEVMYINFSDLEGRTLQAFIALDEETFRQDSRGLKVERAPALVLASKEPAEVRHFSGDQYGNVEAIAYVAGNGGVAMFVLSCRSRAGFDKALPAFKELVSESALVERAAAPPPAKEPAPQPAGKKP